MCDEGVALCVSGRGGLSEGACHAAAESPQCSETN